ncbi:hypothetical protein EMIT079MI2_40105 [Bacillus sp. IT-79MI2]
MYCLLYHIKERTFRLFYLSKLKIIFLFAINPVSSLLFATIYSAYIAHTFCSIFVAAMERIS